MLQFNAKDFQALKNIENHYKTNYFKSFTPNKLVNDVSAESITKMTGGIEPAMFMMTITGNMAKYQKYFDSHKQTLSAKHVKINARIQFYQKYFELIVDGIMNGTLTLEALTFNIMSDMTYFHFEMPSLITIEPMSNGIFTGM